MDNKSKEFKKLQSKWYKKIKNKGFKDIENTDSSMEYLLSWSSSKLNHKMIRFRYNDDIVTYYRWATHFLSDNSFKSVIHKFLWRLHSEGFSNRSIKKSIQQKYGFRVSMNKISVIIAQLATEMKLMYRDEDATK